MIGKSKVNLVIDGIMFLCVMAIVGIGLLIKFILLPGRETTAAYGRKVDLFFLGMDRHVWGTIHLIVACVFLGLLTMHIVLHWKMIFVLYQCLIKSKVIRSVIIVVVIIIGVSFVVFPLFVKPEIRESGRKGWQHHKGIMNNQNDYKDR